MSRFFTDRFTELEPYTPGEQPQTGGFVKLNTNESPFMPSHKAIFAAEQAAKTLQLYSDPKCAKLTAKIAELKGVGINDVYVANGSDEALNFAFGSFCNDTRAAVFPDITYGFYTVFAGYNRVPYRQIPLCDDLSINVDDYIALDPATTGMIVIANPNAPTGLTLSLDEIERIASSNPDIVVVIDEAYVDFGTESAIPLTRKYDNLLVTQTFSKSRAMAGARLGFAIAQEHLIADLNTIKYSTNPYNVNSMTIAAGVGALEDEEYTQKCCAAVMENREYTANRLVELGFELTDSKANFLFAKHGEVSGLALYEELKARKILIRHFTTPRIAEYNRITIGSREQMDTLLAAIEDILAK